MPAKKAAPTPPAPPKVVITVTGSSAVDGVPPGGRLDLDPDEDLERIRRLHLSGRITVTVDGVEISDRHIVAKMEGA